MARILVTGGCGFVGANLIPVLEGVGYTVRVLDNLSRGSREYLHGTQAEIVEGDIRDSGACKEAMAGMEKVIHLAAYGSVVESVEDPLVNFDINAGGTLLILEAAGQAGVDRFVFASTGGALIGDAEPPVNEQSLPRPKSPYGASKLAGEGYCYAYAGSRDLHTVMLRFGNVYGPVSAHKKGAVTAFSKAILTGTPIQIHGDGGASRDFLYVDDLCAGILASLEADITPGTPIHLARGEEVTVDELARVLCEVAGVPGHPIKYGPPRPGEVYRNFAAYARARELLGFEPKIDLPSGLERTWQWFEARREEALATAATDS